MVFLHLQGNLKNLSEALGDVKWKKAMDEGYEALVGNNTWQLVPPSPNKNLIDCRCVYRITKHSDGTVERYKARPGPVLTFRRPGEKLKFWAPLTTIFFACMK
jgi:hypothetical protein